MYTVTYEYAHYAKVWLAHIAGVAGCRVRGVSIRQARRLIRRALAACIGDERAKDAVLVDSVQLPRGTTRQVRAYRASKQALVDATLAHGAARDGAVDALSERGLSLRDCAEVLGVSPQRVQQVRAGKR